MILAASLLVGISIACIMILQLIAKNADVKKNYSQRALVRLYLATIIVGVATAVGSMVLARELTLRRTQRSIEEATR